MTEPGSSVSAIEEFPVVVVGGGVVGLTAALFLAQRGVRCLLVERHRTTSIHPRARGVNGRTAELLRELGLEQAVRHAGARLAPAVGIYSGATLREVLAARGDGGWLARKFRARAFTGRPSKHSPTGPCRCTQDEMEPILLDAARARGVVARWFTELVSIAPADAGVICSLLDRASGERRDVRAEYVIAADGARGSVRATLGIGQGVTRPGGHQMNLYFRADLTELVRGREFSMCQIEQPGFHGLFVSINNADLWVLHVAYSRERGEGPEDFSAARAIELVRRAAGLPALAVELKGALPWESALRIADRYRQGRVFLAGDAAHVMPPWGGFGANTGVQDAHNLAWKLAAVLRGVAGPGLLDSYEAERRPVALAVGQLAASMNGSRGLMRVSRSPVHMFWNMRKVFPFLSLGYGYASDAIALEPGARPAPGSNDLRGRPGTRVPHLWLERRSLAARSKDTGASGSASPSRLSSLDLFGLRHVLLVGARADDWQRAAQALADDELTTVRVGADVFELEHRWHRAYGVEPDGATLVRPDGFVAWRSRRAPASASEGLRELTRVFAQTLCRPSA